MAIEKEKCLDALKVYLGIEPHVDHTSMGSGYYLNWLKIRYGDELVKECLRELNNE